MGKEEYLHETPMWERAGWTLAPGGKWATEVRATVLCPAPLLKAAALYDSEDQYERDAAAVTKELARAVRGFQARANNMVFGIEATFAESEVTVTFGFSPGVAQPNKIVIEVKSRLDVAVLSGTMQLPIFLRDGGGAKASRPLRIDYRQVDVIGWHRCEGRERERDRVGAEARPAVVALPWTQLHAARQQARGGAPGAVPLGHGGGRGGQDGPDDVRVHGAQQRAPEGGRVACPPSAAARAGVGGDPRGRTGRGRGGQGREAAGGAGYARACRCRWAGLCRRGDVGSRRAPRQTRSPRPASGSRSPSAASRRVADGSRGSRDSGDHEEVESQARAGARASKRAASFLSLAKGVHEMKFVTPMRPTDRPRASAGEEISTDFLLEKEKNLSNRR